MGYNIKQFYTVDDLELLDVYIEDEGKDIKLTYDEYHKLYSALHLITRKFPKHKIDIRRKL